MVRLPCFSSSSASIQTPSIKIERLSAGIFRIDADPIAAGVLIFFVEIRIDGLQCLKDIWRLIRVQFLDDDHIAGSWVIKQIRALLKSGLRW